MSSNQGSHRNTQGGNSLSGMVSTLAPTALISLVILIVFLILRKRLQRVYQPRSYLPSLPSWQRSPKHSAGILGWRKEFQTIHDEFVLGTASIDNYLWLRYFKMLTIMCFVGCLITWPILFPVNATGGGGQSGLDILSFSNINPGPRYYAQTFVAWAFLAWVMYLITRESVYFVRLRQRFYSSPYESTRISNRTVLYVNVPQEARNEEFIKKQFAGVRAVWLVNVPEDLAEKVEKRDEAAAKLETGEVKLIKNYVERQLELEKKGQASQPAADAEAEGTSFNIEKDDRPTHRLPVLKVLPLGKKVDTVDWARSELHRLIPEVAEEQLRLRNGASEPQAACFVEFNTVEAAHLAMQQAGLKNKATLTPAEWGIHPDNVIWKNTIKPFAKVQTFNILCTTFVWLLCIFWAIPVAVIGAISNINYLTSKVSFLSFINKIPPVVLGVVTGLLPVVLLAVLMMLVPIIMNILAKLYLPTQGQVQMKVQSWYFPFQVIQVFLITTFASGAASVAAQIVQQPQTAVTLLAKNLPKASNFYISYFILFGLMSTALQFLNVAPLLFFLILGKFLDKTPRKMFNRYVNLGGLGWGSLYPKFTNMGVIALAYSSIAPLVLGFATVGFLLMYWGFRYNALFTLGTTVSTRGSAYARGLQQLTTGIYISEVCLIGLFAIGVGNTNQSIGPLVLMVVFLVGTIVWHIMLNRTLKKMERDLPSEAGTVPAVLANDGELDVEKAPANNGIDSTAGNQTNVGLNDSASKTEANGAQDIAPIAPATPTEKVSLKQRVMGFFTPGKAAEGTVNRLMPHLSTSPRAYTNKEHDEAFMHPAIISETPLVWIAKDKYGLSKHQIAESMREVGEGLDMNDDGAWFNDKGKIEWKHEESGSLEQLPVYEDAPAY